MLLTALALLIGYLTLSISTALLYSTWMSIAMAGSEMYVVPVQFIAIAGICGLGFATLSGYLVGLVARRAPVAHAAVLSLMLIVTWALSTFIGESKEPSLISILNIAIALTGTMVGGWIRYAQVKAADNKGNTVEAKSIKA